MQKEGNGKNEIGELMDDPELPKEGEEQGESMKGNWHK